MTLRSALVAMTSDPGAEDAAECLGDRLGREPVWRSGPSAGRWRVWTAGVELPVQQMFAGKGLVVGDAFPGFGPLQEDPLVRPVGGLPVAELARRLSRCRWGRYLALLEGVDGRGVYRDPSGGMDAFVWSPAEGVQVVASEIERVPGWLRPARWALDWNRIGVFLARPAMATTEALFEGVETVGPGDLRRVIGGEAVTAVWSPADFVDPDVPGEEAAPQLARRFDMCTDALVRGHDRLIVELSGGLDSSIVAGTLEVLGQTGRVAQWLNWNGGFGEADERVYARAVADRLGVELTPVDMIVGRLDPADLAELAHAPWPAMNGVDADTDRNEAARIAASGATAMLSGQGGDAVLFQMPSPAVLVDAMRRGGPAVLLRELLPELARRCNLNVWEVLRRAFRSAPGGPSSPLIAADLRAAAEGVRHAWVRAAEAKDVPPGKRLQIEAVATAHLYHGYSRRRREADFLYPMLAQPVVELCLAIPAAHLAGRAQDRAYAREVFAPRLPEAVLLRRAKGAYNGYVGRLMANSAERLKPFLLEGCLVEAGLLDRVRLEGALDPLAIMQGAQPTYVMWAACVEAWVRHWQTRLPDSLSAPRRPR